LVRENLPFVVTYGSVLDALADRTRRQILEQLVRGPASVAELATRVPVSRPAVSQHLRVLLDAGLVDFDAQGTKNIYRLEAQGFETLRSWLDQLWQDVLDGFEAYANDAHQTKGKPR
jgi:DNA-binding transcriptional ArsR family regulator